MVYWFFFFAFAHRACTALRALSLRSCGVSFLARALPPIRAKSDMVNGFFAIERHLATILFYVQVRMVLTYVQARTKVAVVKQ
jgi:hypothetical protein